MLGNSWWCPCFRTILSLSQGLLSIRLGPELCWIKESLLMVHSIMRFDTLGHNRRRHEESKYSKYCKMDQGRLKTSRRILSSDSWWKTSPWQPGAVLYEESWLNSDGKVIEPKGIVPYIHRNKINSILNIYFSTYYMYVIIYISTIQNIVLVLFMSQLWMISGRQP